LFLLLFLLRDVRLLAVAGQIPRLQAMAITIPPGRWIGLNPPVPHARENTSIRARS